MKTEKLSLNLIIALFFIFCQEVSAQIPWDGTEVATQFAEGDGTDSNPYIISSPAELAYLAKIVNEGNTCAGVYFKLNNDIDLNRKPWIPIGKTKDVLSFEGNVDGNGHIIYNLNIDNPEGCIEVGLFGYVQNNTIQNLGISGNSTICSSMEKVNAGSLVGRAFTPSGGKQVTIKNCFSKAIVIAENSTAGGLIGSLYGSGALIEVTSCYFVGSVTGKSHVGGLIGSTGSKNRINIANCYVAGETNGEGRIGGIAVHTNTGTIKNSFFVNGGKDWNNASDESRQISMEEMRNISFIDEINVGLESVAYKTDFNDQHLNEGLPILLWQQKLNLVCDKPTISLTVNTNEKVDDIITIITDFPVNSENIEYRFCSNQKFSMGQIEFNDDKTIKLPVSFISETEGSFKDTLKVDFLSKNVCLNIPLEATVREGAFLLVSPQELTMIANEGENAISTINISGSHISNKVTIHIEENADAFIFNRSELTAEEVNKGIEVEITFNGIGNHETYIIISTTDENERILEEKIRLKAGVVPAPTFTEAVLTASFDDYATFRVASDSITTVYYVLNTENVQLTAEQIRTHVDRECIVLSSSNTAEIIMIGDLQKGQQYYLDMALEKGPNTEKIPFKAGEFLTSVTNNTQTDDNISITTIDQCIHIQFKDSSLKTISVYDLQGICINNYASNSIAEDINIPERGIYIITVKTDNVIITKKVIL